MAMVEGPAAAVLPGKPYRDAFYQQRTKRQRFRHAVVDRKLARAHLLALLQQLLDLGMYGKTFRIRRQLLRNPLYLVLRDRGGDFILSLVASANIFVPLGRQLAQHRR